jgi:hypothetical protein
MGKWAVLLVLAGVAAPAWAAKSLSVEELDLLLANNQGKPDAHVAQQLAEVELTERVSPERMAKWEKAFAGPRTREELMRLADGAAFLKTPALDTMHIVPPDADTQERMLELAAETAKTAFARLPDFDATRETTRLEDPGVEEQTAGGGAVWHRNPLAMMGGKSDAKPLHVTGSAKATVTFRGGKEIPDAAEEKSSVDGLTPSGEFGELPAIVIGDASRGQVAWSHWEQTAGDPAAVLRYQVAADQSNYIVRVAADAKSGAKFEEMHPAYHGEIAIDPATGSILRVSAITEMPGMYEGMQNAVQVDYAPVTLGDRNCICPVHSVALNKSPVGGAAADAQNATMQTHVSDVVFSDYHLPGPGAAGAAPAASANGASPASPSPAPQ